MKFRKTMLIVLAQLLLWSTSLLAQQARKPNIVFILADDLGWGDVGCYGQKKIKTPNLDRLAGAGMRFTQHYAGNAVCAPSRCVLMTGKHSGHAVIRNNTEVQPEGQQPIPADTVTVAELLKAAGYITGMIGKWGLGPAGSSGDPLRQGFDFFFGYNCQRHAHNHYPTYLWRNDKKVPLAGNPPAPPKGEAAKNGKHFAGDLFETEALGFIKQNKDRPFFLYLPFTIPHVALQVPEDSLAEYKGKFPEEPYLGKKGYLPHQTPRAAYAAMITRMDRTVGRILDLLRELGLEDDTIVFFSSDNGATHGGVGGSDSVFFLSSGPFRGFKGSLFEGGVRVPMIARWPGRIPAGKTAELPSAFYDVLPTLCEIGGAKTPADTDGISFLPTLLNKGEQKRHEFLYWEFFGYGGQQAVRLGDWKGIRQNLHKGNTTLQLFNLKDDVAESKDLAEQHPDVAARMLRIMRESRVPSALYPFAALDASKK